MRRIELLAAVAAVGGLRHGRNSNLAPLPKALNARGGGRERPPPPRALGARGGSDGHWHIPAGEEREELAQQKEADLGEDAVDWAELQAYVTDAA